MTTPATAFGCDATNRNDANGSNPRHKFVVHHDRLLQSLLVVQHDDTLHLVPNVEGGWARRFRITMTEEAKRDRLRPAQDVDPAWLGCPQA